MSILHQCQVLPFLSQRQPLDVGRVDLFHFILFYFITFLADLTNVDVTPAPVSGAPAPAPATAVPTLTPAPTTGAPTPAPAAPDPTSNDPLPETNIEDMSARYIISNDNGRTCVNPNPTPYS